MAIGASQSSNLKLGPAYQTVCGSAHGSWQTSNLDSTSTANQSQYTPYLISSANVQWVDLPIGMATRVLVRAKTVIATTGVTAGAVAVIAAHKINPGTNGDPAANPSNYTFIRVDSTNIADQGITITWASQMPSSSNTLTDATYYYSQLPTTTGYDCLGAQYVCVIATTAASAATSQKMPVYVLVINY